jgi:hypothetical protein
VDLEPRLANAPLSAAGRSYRDLVRLLGDQVAQARTIEIAIAQMEEAGQRRITVHAENVASLEARIAEMAHLRDREGNPILEAKADPDHAHE